MIITKEIMKKIFIFEIFLIFFNGLLTDIMHIPGIITYLPDILNVVLFIFIYRKRKSIKLNNSTDKLIFVFIIWSTITAILNLVSPALFFWEMRNFCRGFIIFYIFFNFMNKEDSKKLYKFLLIFQVFNFIISLYQYFVLGLKQDFLGGIFGVESGVNAMTNIFLCIICTMSIVNYMCHNERLSIVVFVSVTSMLIAAFAELKIFYIEFIIILIASVLLIKPSMKSFGIVSIGLIAILVGLQILKVVFPVHYEALMNIDELMKYSNMHGGGYGISRTHMFKDVNEMFFGENIKYKIMGLGMGACTMSSRFDFFTSEFYLQNGTLNYNWFSHAMLYLQTGIVGLFLYSGILVSMILQALKRLRKNKNPYEYFIMIFAVILLANIMYNHWTRADTSYIAFIGLAMAYVNCVKNDSIKESD